MITQNMKHSLNFPLQSPVTIQPYLDRKEWQGPTLLTFNTRSISDNFILARLIITIIIKLDSGGTHECDQPEDNLDEKDDGLPD